MIRQSLNGQGGIRTHETGLPFTRFPGVRLQPLGHLSCGTEWNKASLGTRVKPASCETVDSMLVHLQGEVPEAAVINHFSNCSNTGLSGGGARTRHTMSPPSRQSLTASSAVRHSSHIRRDKVMLVVRCSFQTVERVSDAETRRFAPGLIFLE